MSNKIWIAAFIALSGFGSDASAAQEYSSDAKLLWHCGATLLPCRAPVSALNKASFIRAANVAYSPLRASYAPVFPASKTKR